MSSDIGVYGLSIMGQNLALNIASHGFKVSVCNRSEDKVTSTVKRGEEEGVNIKMIILFYSYIIFIYLYK